MRIHLNLKWHQQVDIPILLLWIFVRDDNWLEPARLLPTWQNSGWDCFLSFHSAYDDRKILYMSYWPLWCSDFAYGGFCVLQTSKYFICVKTFLFTKYSYQKWWTTGNRKHQKYLWLTGTFRWLDQYYDQVLEDPSISSYSWRWLEKSLRSNSF